jgi:hypothetical protein
MGIVRPSPGLMARLGKSIAKQSEGRAGEKYLPVGGRVRKSRAVEDQSASIPEEVTSELGGSICNLVRRPHVDQGAPCQEKKQASLEESNRWMMVVRCAQ